MDGALTPALASTADVVTPYATTCHTCARPLTGPRRGRSTARRSYPCIPPLPPDPSTNLLPRLCERCWRRARYNDPTDPYRQQVRDKQRRWHAAQRQAREEGAGRRGAGRQARSTAKTSGRRSAPPPPAFPLPQAQQPVSPRRVSSAQRLLAGR